MKTKKGSWIVRMTCEVEKEIICDNCTEEQAEEKPWDYVVSEIEKSMTDWSVSSVEPNE